MWLPPTPPSDDCEEFCIDTALEMNYDTQSVISPAVLAAIAPFRWFIFIIVSMCLLWNAASYSEDDYDVFGLRRQTTDNGIYL